MNYKPFSDEYFMNFALIEAKKALENNEVPIGAIVVIKNQIIAKAYNQTETLQDPTAHAEILAITSACNYLGSKYLEDATLFVTLEPCVMCAGAIFWTKIKKLIFGAFDEKQGYSRIQKKLPDGISILHPKLEITSEILEKEAAYLLKTFFQTKRKF